MTRKKAEANWIWDEKRGDVRPPPPEWPKNRRLRCSDKNIMAQHKLARRGTLIHTSAKTSCPRKFSGYDVKNGNYILKSLDGLK